MTINPFFLAAYAIGFAPFALAVGLSIFGLLSRRASLTALSLMACRDCHELFGRAKASKTRKDHLEMCKAAHRLYPGEHLYFGQEWKVTCDKCGSKSLYNYLTKTSRAPRPGELDEDETEGERISEES